MTASQARVLYMDDYIDFEHNIINIANHISKSNHFTIGNLYQAINYLTMIRFHNIKAGKLNFNAHRLMRNWLSHSVRTKEISKKQIILCNKIIYVNKKLYNYLKTCQI